MLEAGVEWVVTPARLALLLVGATMVAPASAQEHASPQTPVFATGTDLVNVTVTVRDPKGRFVDGELVCGYTMAYSPGREGFFVVPADSASNNIRIYVVSAAAAEIGSGPGADALVQKHLTASRSK